MTDMRILIVDDDPAIRKTLDEVLQLENYQTTLAASGAEALRRLRTEPRPGLILLDLMMPDLNGWEFLHELQKDPDFNRIPVVVFTALNTPEVGGVAAHLKKPLSLDALLEAIERHYAHVTPEAGP